MAEVLATILNFVFGRFFKKKDTLPYKIERAKEKLEFYSPLANRVGREDYQKARNIYPKGIVQEIIKQTNLEKNYKIMAEPDLKELLDRILSGNVTTWNKWQVAHIELERLVQADFKKIQEEYDTLMSD